MLVLEVLQYLGPNRRSEHTVIEWKMELSAKEQQVVALAAEDDFALLYQMLIATGLEPLAALTTEGFSQADSVAGDQPAWRSSPLATLLQIVARIALALQRSAGHRVRFYDIYRCASAMQMRMVFESEQAETALNAAELALRLCSQSLPGLQWQADPALPGSSFQDGLDGFLQQARSTVLSLETQAFLTAAAQRDIPCAKLERAPYAGLQGDFRIRPNGLLRLGHACHQLIIDGSLCLQRSAALIPLLFDRNKVHETLQALQLPVARQASGLRHLVTAKRAARAADLLGYPVVLKPLARSPKAARLNTPIQLPQSALNSAQDVRLAFEQAKPDRSGVIIEEYVSGQSVHLLLAGMKLLCALDTQGLNVLDTELHNSLVEMAERVAVRLVAGLLVVTVISTDLSRPLQETGGAVVDLDPAPDLGRLLCNSTSLLQLAAEIFLDWLFPAGSQSRIPLIAVTGTNGKTTTCKMTARIMQAAGYRVGMASTSGVYIDQQLISEGDLAGSEGHHLIFESGEVNLGVLETARGGIAHSGFMFDHCDVAVCLNVSEDHLGEYGIRTLADMVEIKRSVLLRARKAIVINADYETCLNMLPVPGPVRLYAATLHKNVQQVRELLGSDNWVCVCEIVESSESIAGEEWIVLYGPGGERQAVIAVNQIPATFDGSAGFNISNAQHAICASHALGVNTDLIKAALSEFDSSFENNPGRLNIYRGLPFTVVMDYAHNVDGLENIGRFLERQPVSGKKILLYAVTGNRTVEALRKFSMFPVDMFDHFVCRCYPGRISATRPEFPGLMKQALLEVGVKEECITLVDVPEDGPRVALSLARPGDLVMICSGTKEFSRIWSDIQSFEPLL